VKRERNAPHGKPFKWSGTRGFATGGASLAGTGRVYRQAAQTLFDAIGASADSFEAHPLVFLYRHSVEAYIKAILFEFGPRIGLKRKEVKDRRHDLCKQLPDLLRVSQLQGNGMSRATQEGIQDLNGDDPNSTTFRYDLQPAGKTLDIVQFVLAVESIIDELANIYDELRNNAYGAASQQAIKETE